MLFRRLLIASSALLLLLAAIALTATPSIGSSTSGKFDTYRAQIATSARFNQQSLNCPDAPPPLGQGIFLDFCSPKYVGDVAGPFGSHIVLVAENFPGTPQKWIISKDNPVTNTQGMMTCIRGNTCSYLAQPTRSRQLDKSIMLFSWIWNDSFPKQKGDYYIIAIIGNPSAANVQIESTPIGFTLLTSQAPCITLSSGDSSTDCVSATPSLSVNPSNTTTLTINGSNWILAWSRQYPPMQYPVTEMVDVSATCETQNSCNLNQLFEIKIQPGQINRKGSFNTRVSLPESAKGTYVVHATNSVVQVATPGVPHAISSNTIANGSLTFGEPGDPITLFINATTPTPTSTPTPTTTPTPPHKTTPSPEKVDIVALNIFAIVAALPAFIGIIVFVAICERRRRAIKQLRTLGTSDSHATSSEAISRGNQVTSPSYKQENLVEHEYFLFPFESLILPPVKKRRHVRRLPFISIDRKIQKALMKWKQESQLSDVVALASKMLVDNFSDWWKLAEELEKNGPRLPLDEIQKMEQEAIKAIHHMQTAKDARSLRLYCSKALVNYIGLLPFMHLLPSNNQVAIQFDMGLAYMYLARIAQKTAVDLLHSAGRCYLYALEFYQIHGISGLCARTLIALGDVNFDLAKLSGKNFDEYLQCAWGYYQRAHKTMLSYLPQDLQIDYNTMPPEMQINYNTILSSLTPEIQWVLKERILVIYLSFISTRIPPMSFDH